MPKKLAGIVVASIAIAVGMAIFVTGANGIAGVDVSVPELQAPSQLSGSAPTPQVSVPSVSVPSAPSVSAPSAPSVSAPSAPSVRLPSGQSGSGSSTNGGGGGGSSSSSGGGGGSASYGSTQGSGGSGSTRTLDRAGGAAASTPAANRRARARARRERAWSRHLMTEVKAMRGCLGMLPATERRLLGLRAGLAGRALSRGAAAKRLGISATRARGLERAGLRSMRGAARAGGCGTSTGSTSSPATQAFPLAAQGSSMPQLQPLATLSNPPALVPTGKSRQRPRQQVAGTSASSGPQGPEAPSEASRTGGLATASAPASGDTRSVPLTVLLAIVFGLFVLAGATAMARQYAARRDREPQELADWMPDDLGPVAAPAREVKPEPQVKPEPEIKPEPAPAVVVAAATIANGNGNGHANGNGHGNGNGHAVQNGNGNGHAVARNGNGDGNGNGHAPVGAGNGYANGNGHHNGNGNGRPNGGTDLKRVARPAAIAASGLVSLAVSRMVRGRRK